MLAIDDTLDRGHGHQQLSLVHGHYDSRCFLPRHVDQATTGTPVAVILRPGKTPDGTEMALVPRHVVPAIRVRRPAVDLGIRGDRRFIVTNLAGAPRWLLRAPPLRSRPGRELDQGAQAAPRLQPDVLLKGDGPSVPAADPSTAKLSIRSRREWRGSAVP